MSDKQEGLLLFCILWDCWWHSKLVALKYHWCWVENKAKLKTESVFRPGSYGCQVGTTHSPMLGRPGSYVHQSSRHVAVWSRCQLQQTFQRPGGLLERVCVCLEEKKCRCWSLPSTVSIPLSPLHHCILLYNTYYTESQELRGRLAGWRDKVQRTCIEQYFNTAVTISPANVAPPRVKSHSWFVLTSVYVYFTQKRE